MNAVGPDSLVFDFVFQSAGDVDSLGFVAREAAWASTPAVPAALGTIGPGGTATARFLVATTAQHPGPA